MRHLIVTLITHVVIIPILIMAVSWNHKKAWGQDTSSGRYSDDLEAYGGISAAYSGGGTSAADEITAIRANPAMIAQSKKYRMRGTFHWPTYGRTFYQAGVVDGTGPVKAGIQYTAPLDRSFEDPLEAAQNLNLTERQNLIWGMQTIQRFNLSLAQSFGKLSVGITGSYVEGMQRPYRSYSSTLTQGITLGMGISAPITESLIVSASAENLNNQRLSDLAPTIYRAGVSTWIAEVVGIHGDFIHRQRVRSEWVLVPPQNQPDDPTTISLLDQRPSLSRTEQSIVTGVELNLENILKIVGSYRHEIGSDGLQRRSLSGGIAISQGLYKITYTVRRPYLSDHHLHQAVSLSLIFEFS